jgi:DNA-binding transcriptional MerR regulator
MTGKEESLNDPVGTKEYYSISEVCDITRLKPHVLRYWETQFTLLRPPKNRAGNRSYRKKEIQLIQLIKYLLYVEKYTIEGAQQKLKRLRRDPDEELEIPPEEIRARDIVASIGDDVREIVEILRG